MTVLHNSQNRINRYTKKSWANGTITSSLSFLFYSIFTCALRRTKSFIIVCVMSVPTQVRYCLKNYRAELKMYTEERVIWDILKVCIFNFLACYGYKAIDKHANKPPNPDPSMQYISSSEPYHPPRPYKVKHVLFVGVIVFANLHGNLLHNWITVWWYACFSVDQ